ncbi:MAG TPA: 16S rRNA (cytidine(1402)-2'-O)-methyltransferase [Bacteroidales bacterium]|nr:16S rRNA (cytidine(1402)-2'-O)-methyltransferase [Bacteroidales bacterium]HRZ50114.1 16S rRNA (cytidine(1402)-2'-O)-methyltransferase [Bacteroidales bacterium]
MARITLVPTPLGNLSDITLRSLEALRQADLILAEDTRTTGILLKHFDIKTRLVAYHLHNEHQRTGRILDEAGEDSRLVLVTDAGTPGISDPGFLLVREALQRGMQVECLPGPVAFVPALVASGLPCDRFHFEGFLPPKKGRMTRLAWLAGYPFTLVLYESPHRLLKTLGQMAEVFGGERRGVVVRELSKIHEEYHRGTLAELETEFTSVQPRGEIVLIVEGKG